MRSRGVVTSIPDLKRTLMRHIRHYNEASNREAEVLRVDSPHRYFHINPLRSTGRVGHTTGSRVVSFFVRSTKLVLTERTARSCSSCVDRKCS